MNIKDFISQYRNHPVLFVGTGLSKRFLEKSYSWDELLSYISFELIGSDEFYLDIKNKCYYNGKYNLPKAASLLEKKFNEILEGDRDGKFKEVNDLFYLKMKEGINVSRFKVYVSLLLTNYSINKDKKEEFELFKKIRKNIGSIVTTNYDNLIERTFEFMPLIGNDILLSNPYGSVYKIHGCVSSIDKIIITEEDYKDFEKEYELIRAQLLSLFIHNPIIFIGYSIEDENIRKLLKTIFTYVKPDTEQAIKIRSNFLLIEYEENSVNEIITEHDFNIGDSTIRINKIKTDNYSVIFKSLSSIHLPISAMDIRKVQGIVKDIYTGESAVKVSITEDLDLLNNGDKVLAIGSHKTIKYEYQTVGEIINNYFEIIDEANYQLLSLIDKHKIQCNQYFPIYGFSLINEDVVNIEKLKKQQLTNISKANDAVSEVCKVNYDEIDKIIDDESIAKSNKPHTILWNVLNKTIKLDELEQFLKSYPNEDKDSNYRKLLCAYDLVKYNSEYVLE
ncbi:SIR2 family protein [Wenyingzhuangia aestuarii]|uniref:SIR2 family protein n=1 Tax=Wenyingzhuangia aestuarii TaxID=1647582 RepID=UPI00143B75F8|nr:SIR2 family protein [Wenyingzhuangia aestuarii]NJB83136.1 hypothetical protein [Wenyingzhuangia aestuarii]